ncbi:LysR substrate-binding domain-containing protein [Xylophilus sp. GW821-FHT01B05]
MARLLPSLSALRAFEAVARLGSVTLAAQELARTHGAVSRQLRTLQEQAGVPLFDKVGTGLRPNAAGTALQLVAAQSLDVLEQGWRDLLDEARAPALHVACSATFAMRWLVPRLGGFYRRYPSVRVRLSMTSAREIRYQGADLVIAWDRSGFPPQDEARAIRLGEVAFGPVHAPGYAARVAKGTLRCRTGITHEYTSRAWDSWRERSGLQAEWKEELRFPHTHLCIEAAVAGLGVALVEQRLVADDLATGRLLAPCGFTPFPDGLAAIPTSARAALPAAQAFVAWLAETLK